MAGSTVLTALGGRAAEEIFFGSASDLGCKLDDEKVTRLIEADGFRERFFAFDLRRDALLAHTRKLIGRNRDAVERVALALLDRETLSGAEIPRSIAPRNRDLRSPMANCEHVNKSSVDSGSNFFDCCNSSTSAVTTSAAA
jgi:hypothetical protein